MNFILKSTGKPSAAITIDLNIFFYFPRTILKRMFLLFSKSSRVHGLREPRKAVVLVVAGLAHLHDHVLDQQCTDAQFDDANSPAHPPRRIVPHCGSHPGYPIRISGAMQGFRSPHVFSLPCIYSVPGNGRQKSLGSTNQYL